MNGGQSRPRVGVVGLGAMGGPIAGRLLDAGYTVYGYNRTARRAAALRERGLRWCERPVTVAAQCEVVITMVRDDAALAAVSYGDAGLLAQLPRGAVWVEMSTVSPTLSEALAAQAADRGAHFLQAPVSGSVPHAKSGQLTIIVAGQEAAFKQVEGLLAALGSTLRYVGPLSNALQLKLAINLSIALQTVGFAEGLTYAIKAGINPKLAADVLLSSAIASPMLKARGPLALERPPEAWFDVSLLQKDLAILLAEGRAKAVPLPLTGVANELLSALTARGAGGADVIALYDLIAELAGLPRQQVASAA